MTFPTPAEAATSGATHTEIQVNNSWVRMDVPGGWIYRSVIVEGHTKTAHVIGVFVPEPLTLTEDDIKHESGKVRILKALLPFLGRLIKR